MSSRQDYPRTPKCAQSAETIIDRITRFSIEELSDELVRLRKEAEAIERYRKVLLQLHEMKRAES